MSVIERRECRGRLEALDNAIGTIEEAWGDIADMLMDSVDHHGVEVELKDAIWHGFPEDALANDVKLEMWEVFGVLLATRDVYAAHVKEAEVKAIHVIPTERAEP